MPSQYSPLLRIELPAPGEQGNTWGDTTNNNLGSLIEGAVAGTSLITTLPATLTELNGAADTSRPMILNVTAPLVANSYIEAPAKSKVYVVYNHTTGGYNLTIKTASSTGVTIPNGKAKVVFYDTQLADYKEAVTAADVFFLTGSITDDAQATTKKYVDDKAGNYVPLNGSAPMTGNLTLPNSTLLVSDPDTYATPKGYVLPKSGGTMTGTLTLSSGSQTAPTGDQAIGKTYADNTYLTKGRKLISGTTGTLTFSQGASTGLSEVILGNGDVTLSVTSGGGAAGVTSFNTRTGAVTLTSSDVTSALTYTPYSNTNPTGYQTAAQVSSAISSGTAGSSNNANALGGVYPSGYLRTDGYQVGSIMTGALLLNRGGAENAWVDTVVSGGTRYAVLGSYTSSSVNFAPIVIAQGNASTNQLVMNATTSGDANFYHNVLVTGNLTVNSLAAGGSVSASAGGTLIISSDKNLKKDDGFVTDALDKINALLPRYFYWRDDLDTPQISADRQLGFYAQEVQAVCEEASPTGRGIYDRALVALLVKATQELNAKIEALTIEVNTLKGV